MKLTIVIPALNEEQAIASIIERTLAARTVIIDNSPVDDVEIIVVSDGSTDRTALIAGQYPEIKVIVFEKNRGYGAAIKRGFEEGTGELVGFLDADGTCNPEFFATLCRALFVDRASIALGSRMGPQSRMPAIRRLGNRVYALLLSTLSNRVVTDSASGMRVIRREVLPRLYPLPSGLHFTPAMSARALMDHQLRIVERPMPYEERIGNSKLHVLRDGVRFLRTILEMTLMWRPAKLFVAAAMFCLAVMTLVAMHPIEMWLRTGHLQEDMIYRLLFCSFLGTTGATLLSSAVVCDRLRRCFDDRPESDHAQTFLWSLLDRAVSLRGLIPVSTMSLPLIGWLVGQGIWTWISAGYVTLHWSRVVLAGLVLFTIGQMAVTTLTVRLIQFHQSRNTAGAATAALVRSAERRIDTTQPKLSNAPPADELATHSV